MASRVDRIKPANFDGSWTLFHHEFEVVAEHNSWVNWEKATHLLAVWQGQATNFLHNIPTEARCDDIIEALEGCYRDHQLAVAYCFQLIGRFLQKFATSIEQLAQCIFIGLSQCRICKKAACAFVNGIRDGGEALATHGQ
jgi:hypothetical protein